MGFIIKPGLIDGPGRDDAVNRTVQAFDLERSSIPSVHVRDVAAAALEVVVGGVDQDTLENDDLIRLGQTARARLGEDNNA